MKIEAFTIPFIVIILALTICLGISCERGKDSDPYQSEGLVLFYGEPAADGCGWMIQIDSVDYSPVFLEPIFKEDSLKVIIEYRKLDSTWHCGWRSLGYQYIELLNIQLKNN